jgi:hypothetical protein
VITCVTYNPMVVVSLLNSYPSHFFRFPQITSTIPLLYDHDVLSTRRDHPRYFTICPFLLFTDRSALSERIASLCIPIHLYYDSVHWTGQIDYHSMRIIGLCAYHSMRTAGFRMERLFVVILSHLTDLLRCESLDCAPCLSLDASPLHHEVLLAIGQFVFTLSKIYWDSMSRKAKDKGRRV